MRRCSTGLIKSVYRHKRNASGETSIGIAAKLTQKFACIVKKFSYIIRYCSILLYVVECQSDLFQSQT